jgi:hypothetical protein
MKTAEIVRFATKRQALALMNHPAFAKVFDAGFKEEGTPLVVTEYTVGVPIGRRRSLEVLVTVLFVPVRRRQRMSRRGP